MSQTYPENNIPTIIVVLGATGDLMAKKIIPSILHLFTEDKIPSKCKVVGFARKPFTDQAFKDYVATILQHTSEYQKIRRTAQQFLDIFSYQVGDFKDVAAFQSLHSKLKAIDDEWGVCTNKVLYLAVAPEWFVSIFKNLAVTKLNLPCGGKKGWTRVLIEKPFGHDLTSANQLEKLLGRHFKEEQIYRIDHYLAKELIQGIIHFRFSNNLLESAWDNTTIEKIEIRVLETVGVEQRGSFYDRVGALRDVGQNHLLEMLAALTMDYPHSMQANELRSKRAALLTALQPWTVKDIQRNVFRAQHHEYQHIKGVATASHTETYFKLKTELTNTTWQGVPMYLEAGKSNGTARKEIVVTFKHPPTCLLCTAQHHTQNRVVFTLEPEARITIHFWTKKPGYEKELEERTFDFFVYDNKVRTQYVEDYSKLLLACIMGDQTLFVSKDEVRAQWKFIDPIIKVWQKNTVPLYHYQAGSDVIQHQATKAIQQSLTQPLPKELAIIGLGKMGVNMARRLMDQGWRVVGYNLHPAITHTLAKEGVIPAESVAEAIQQLPKIKIVWLMVPAGKPVDDVLFGKNGLVHYLQRGDIIIDGGNSYYKDTIARAKKLHKHGITLLDCGTSGGPNGARHGACLMVGGNKTAFEKIELLFKDFALPNGYQFFPESGAGHFVKMVHNGIEFGMMQAIAEGFAVLHQVKFKLDLQRVADIYNHGSVIESRLIGWLHEGFQLYGQKLSSISGSVDQLGEGAWTVQTARELKVAAKVIKDALQFRYQSQHQPSYTGKVVSVLRNRFGGHNVSKRSTGKL